MSDDEKKPLRDPGGTENTLPPEEAGIGEMGSASTQGVGPGEAAAGFLSELEEAGRSAGRGPVWDEPAAHKNLLEMIYGVLFDPVKTFRGMAEAPPIGRVLLIFTVVSVLGAVMGYYLSSRMIPGEHYGGMRPLAGVLDVIIPLMVFVVIIIAYAKWIVYSGLLHLVAEIFGGKGRALGVLAVTGLATLPVILLMPFELVVVLAGGQAPITTIILGLLGMVSQIGRAHV